MAYVCPRCSGLVERPSSRSAQWTLGFVGALVYSSLRSFECRRCGKIPRREFPKEVRTEMIAKSVALAFTDSHSSPASCGWRPLSVSERDIANDVVGPEAERLSLPRLAG